jgi:osmoprotectant transport system ATP-binding protein
MPGPRKLGARLELQDVVVRRGGRNVVDGISLSIEAGELVVLIGPSGSGKTTLLGTINRLVEPDDGTLLLGGEDTRALAPHELRRKVGYCFQGLGLFPHLTVAENIGITPRLLGWDPERVRARAEDLLVRVGLTAAHGARLPSELSGGQAQRVAVARALAAEPPVLLLDEPFGALDPDTRVRLQEELAELHRDLGMTTILVSHDLAEALTLATKIAVLVAGRVVQYAPPREVVEHPASEQVTALIEPARKRALAVAALGAPSGPAVPPRPPAEPLPPPVGPL